MSFSRMITQLDGRAEMEAREMLLSLVSLQAEGEALFSDRLPLRRMGYPFHQHDLTADQWSRLVRAAFILEGIPSSCLMASLGPGRAFDKVFQVELGETYPYSQMISHGWPGVYDSIVCDMRGAWAIIVNSEDSAILGATETDTSNALTAIMHEFSDTGLEQLVRYWQERFPQATDRAKLTTWIERHLRHCYSNSSGLLMALVEGR